MRALAAALTFAAGLCLPAPARALVKYADWARIQSTGAVNNKATVRVLLARTTSPAAIFDATGTALLNPFSVEPDGHYKFFAAPGEYDVEVHVRTNRVNEIYTIPGVLLVDPNGGAQVCSSTTAPALTTVQASAEQPSAIPLPFPLGPPPPEGNDDWTQLSTTHLRLDRRTPAGALDGLPWFIVGYRAEQGWAPAYNTFGHYSDAPLEPGPMSDGGVWGTNTADFGLFHLGEFYIDWHNAGVTTMLGTPDGGVWLASSAGSSVNVDMAIAGAAVGGDVVALSTTTPGAVVRTTTQGARAPFVVTSVQGNRATVAVDGVADVNATAPIAVGDVLMTSDRAGFAIKAPPGTPAPSTVGSALTALEAGAGSGTVRVRIGMVAQ